MTILALDLTSEYGSLAIRRNRRTLLEQSIHSPDGFAHLVFSAIDEILSRAGINLAEIHCFASASGPGAFTGVRVGLSAVKGLAEALGKRAIGVSNLRALASFGSSPLRAVVLDARRGDVFTSVYDADLH
ncbi:MAG: tRNA (adenosine(37)-N6)-threonylcarbamoyltransferase complex dimerization subunit type 1 TsaB, partial [Bryobacteraceae bacterium]